MGKEPCKWSMKYRSVVGMGRARILENDQEKAYGLRLITKKYTGNDSSFDKSALDSVAVVRIDIDSLTGTKLGY
jgi:nitroimidazol reductase NimA-like FMN-containing flavoprotein (pyridoxamine 5'-phosphate oxidase superfamily)